MTGSAPLPSPSTEAPPRVLARSVALPPGPTLVAVGGLHGNEPAGVAAIRRLAGRLAEAGGVDRGEFVGLAGNRQALVRGRRYLDLDLNRIWRGDRLPAAVSAPEVGAARGGPGGPDGNRALGAVEEREQAELGAEIERIAGRARGPLFVLDLHTTSGAGGPFIALGDTLANRAFGLRFPVPLVLGLEEQVDGTLHEYLEERGVVSLVFESGRHEDPRSVDRAEAALWVGLGVLGLANPSLAAPRRATETLARETQRLPQVVEMRHREPVPAEGGFRMRPGFRNFQPVRAGEALAHAGTATIRAREDGLLLMPLYQELGNDGFFLVRPFRPGWLRLSAFLRRMSLDRVLHRLPGVTRDPEREEELVVDRHVARWFALEVFHLLGYRRVAEDARTLRLRRRPSPRVPEGADLPRRGMRAVPGTEGAG